MNMKKTFLEIIETIKGFDLIKTSAVACVAVVVFVLIPSYADALESGVYAVKSPDFCGPCNTVKPVLEANNIPIFSGGSPEGAALLKVAESNSYPTVVALDSNGDPIAKLTDASQITKERLDEMKKMVKDRNAALESKNVEDRCYLIVPGMSKTNGEMYGTMGVKAFNDYHEYMEDIIGECLGVVYPEQPTPEFKDTETITPEPCVYAVDREGKPALKGLEEDKLNFLIREKEIKEPDKFFVTMDKDFNALVEQGKDEIRKGDKVCPRMSNEKCIRTEAEKGNIKADKAQPDGPTRKQHEEYWITPGDKGYMIPPPGKDAIKMNPGICKKSVKGKPDCKSFGSKDADVAVSETCEYTKSTAVAPEAPKSGFDWNKNKGNGQGNGGGNGSGGGGMDKALQSLLPALMQALKGMGSGSQNSSATPTPTPTSSASSYSCPTPSANEQVCGNDGATYSSRCIAEYEKQVTVKHTGACTAEDEGSESSTVSAISDLLNQLLASGMSESMISSVTQAIIDLITGTTSGTVSHTAVN